MCNPYRNKKLIFLILNNKHYGYSYISWEHCSAAELWASGLRVHVWMYMNHNKWRKCLDFQKNINVYHWYFKNFLALSDSWFKWRVRNLENRCIEESTKMLSWQNNQLCRSPWDLISIHPSKVGEYFLVEFVQIAFRDFGEHGDYRHKTGVLIFLEIISF